MGERFYPAGRPVLGAALLLLAAACGETEAPPAAPSNWFPTPTRLIAPYEAPADGDLLPRFLAHLDGASRDSLHFAMERVPEYGARAAAALVAGIEERIPEPDRFGSLHNYAKALGGCGSREDADVLVRIVRESPVPLARSGAAESIGDIGGPEHAAALIRALGVETESGPFQAYFGALRRLGGPEVLAFFAEKVRAWAAGEPGSGPAGNLAWSQLLELDEPEAAPLIAELAPLLPGPSFQVTALRRRAELGEAGLGAELRRYLDPAAAPAAGTRVVAVEGLGFAGDWEGVLLAFEDADPQLHLAALNALSLPAARETRVGHERLEELARTGSPEMAQAAMHALCLRDDRRLLEPWLVRARTYPHGPGSVDAINLLKHEDVGDPRTVPALLQAWEGSDPDARTGLLRVFGSLKDERAVPLIRGLVLEGEPGEANHQMAITQLANLGELGLPVMLELLERPVEEADAQQVVSSLAALAQEHDAALERLVAWARDEELPDPVRASVLALLPKVLGAAAQPVLLEVRDGSRRGEVRAVLDALLSEFY